MGTTVPSACCQAFEIQNIIVDNISALLLNEPPDSYQSSPKLLELVSLAIRARHYSRRTEDSYKRWIKRLILFNNKQHPLEMGEEEVTRFLSYLATERNVSASTQNQALNAILFLYREVLKMELDLERIKAARPVVAELLGKTE